MRITCTSEVARSTGREYQTFLNRYVGNAEGTPISHTTLQIAEDKFHGEVNNPGDYARIAREHAEAFSAPFWNMFRDHYQSPEQSEHVPLGDEDVAILPGFKEAPDLIVTSVQTDQGLLVPEINIDKGGLASNTAHALRGLGAKSVFIPLIGTGSIAEIHRDLIAKAGVDLSDAVIDPEHDSYLHACMFHGYNDEPKNEYWNAQYRQKFPDQTIEEFTAVIRRACAENPGKPLVLSAHPPAGSGDDYFRRLIDAADEFGNPTMFNSKEYDPMKAAVTHMFNQGKLGYVKPNLVELVQFLQYAGIVEDGSVSKRNEILFKLQKQTESGDFKETIDLTKKLIDKVNPEMVVFLSYGAHGGMAVNRRFVVLSTAPKIGSDGCSSGAGDSGLAGVIKTAADLNLNLRNGVDVLSLYSLLEGFVVTASATASLPGNQIATQNDVDKLMLGQELKTRLYYFA